MPPGAAMQAKAERGRRKQNKWHHTACHPPVTPLLAAPLLWGTQTGRGAGLGICKIPSGMEQSCGLGRVQTWPSLTTTPKDKSFIARG